MLIKDVDGYFNCSLWAEMAYDNENYHFKATVISLNNLVKKHCNIIPDYIISNNMLAYYTGYYKNYYITDFSKNGLLIITDIDNEKIEIGIKDNFITNKNYYLVFKTVIQHFCKLIYKYDSPLHASCVKTGNDCIVIIGKSGTGKSSLLFDFFKLGYDIVADDICVLDRRNKTISGFINSINLRPDMIRHLNKDIYSISQICPGRKISIKIPERTYDDLNPKYIICLLKPNIRNGYIIKKDPDKVSKFYLKNNSNNYINWYNKSNILLNDLNKILKKDCVNCFEISLGKPINEMIFEVFKK